MNNPRISIIAALGKHNKSIGKNNKLLWYIPDDLKHFKKVTGKHPVIMGRKTFKSILETLGKPLPGRKNIVITRQRKLNIPDDNNVLIANSTNKALSLAKKLDEEEIFIIGGQQIYEQTLLLAHRLYLTLVDSDKKGDTFFPSYKNIFTKEMEREEREYEGLNYIWLTLEKNDRE